MEINYANLGNRTTQEHDIIRSEMTKLDKQLVITNVVMGTTLVKEILWAKG